jgi:hypothetical protein
MFRCLEPTLIIAASLSFRSPFFAPFDKREEADAVKKASHHVAAHSFFLLHDYL